MTLPFQSPFGGNLRHSSVTASIVVDNLVIGREGSALQVAVLMR